MMRLRWRWMEAHRHSPTFVSISPSAGFSFFALGKDLDSDGGQTDAYECWGVAHGWGCEAKIALRSSDMPSLSTT